MSTRGEAIMSWTRDSCVSAVARAPAAEETACTRGCTSLVARVSAVNHPPRRGRELASAVRLARACCDERLVHRRGNVREAVLV